jgi:UDPglucose 6-dehydrogenase
MEQMDKISVVGLGKLGQCLATCFAARGFETIGVDVDNQVVDSINRGVPSVIEPGLQELVATAGRRLRATQDYEEAINNTNVTVILVPTPSHPDANFSNRYVESALKSLAGSLRGSRKDYHVFVVSSTVMPGSIEGRLVPLVEEFSGRQLNVGFGVCYCPELVALGNVVRGFLNPDLVMIGQSDDRAGGQVASIYRRLCENDPPIFQMSIIDAEIAKLSLNCYITLKMSFANSLANICENVPDANVDVITQALGADRRIALHYLQGGLSYGGPCFRRDTKAFIAFAKKFDNHAELINVVEKVNEFQDRHLADVVLRHAPSIGDGKISILGLAFKPGTPAILESPAIKLIEELLRRGMKVSVYDPLAMENTKTVLGDRVEYTPSVRECMSDSRLCVIATQAEEFKHIDASYIGNDSMTIIDCWRVLDPSKLGKRAKYVALGRFSADIQERPRTDRSRSALFVVGS